MTTPMDQAVKAAKKGKKEEAQRVLANYLASDPQDDQAWYLMSQLVDSDARRAAYLGKTLAINPWHERAWAEFYSLPPDVITLLETSSSSDAAESAETEAAATATVASAAALPEWLQPVAGDQPIAVQPIPEQSAKAQDLDPDRFYLAEQEAEAQEEKSEDNQTLTIVLTLLLIATIAVLGYLVFLLLQG